MDQEPSKFNGVSILALQIVASDFLHYFGYFEGEQWTQKRNVFFKEHCRPTDIIQKWHQWAAGATE